MNKQPSRRLAHLVGSLPAPDARQGMELSLEMLGDHITQISDGETGERFNWVAHVVEGMRDHPDLELRRDGDWSDYNKCPVFKLKRGHKLRPETLNFGHVQAFDESWPIFEELRAKSGTADLAFQQGVPGDLDMAFFVFGPWGLLHRKPFTEATVDEIRRVHERAPDDVVFQIEIPVEQVFVAKMPAPLQPLMARVMARGVVALARQAPRGARFGVHLCVGDLNHKALARMKDARPIVLLANAIVRQWPSGVALEYVHGPFAAAAAPPSVEESWYAPLRDLALPPGVRFVAGFAHEEQSLEQQQKIRKTIEHHAGRTVDISTACGLGRRTPEAGKAALARMRELIAEES